MKHTSEYSSTLADAAADLCSPAAQKRPTETDSLLSPNELAQIRQEKLDAIRVAIAAGAYDSEDLLEKAMDLMLRRLESSDCDPS